MTDMQTLLQTVDELSPEELRELYLYIVENHIQFRGGEAPESKPQKRILGLHAHLGPSWMSDDFDAELPDEFWFGKE
jgi:hypothetical protein